MLILDEVKESQPKASNSNSDMLFLALNNFDEFEREILEREQDPSQRAIRRVKSS